MEVVVLADTHLTGGLDRLPSEVLAALHEADAVLHAGDVVSPRALRELASLAPLRAVLGNNDRDLGDVLPDDRQMVLEGVRVAMIHDSGPSRGRPGRLHRRFPDADLVVFGHSHVPLNATGVDGQVLFNPGSPTLRRAQPHPSFGRLVLEAGRVLERRIELLQPRGR